MAATYYYFKCISVSVRFRYGCMILSFFLFLETLHLYFLIHIKISPLQNVMLCRKDHLIPITTIDSLLHDAGHELNVLCMFKLFHVSKATNIGKALKVLKVE